MRNFAIDCEFNGLNGQLLTLCLVEEKTLLSLYLKYPITEAITPWVAENVLPIIGITIDNEGEPLLIKPVEVDGPGQPTSHELLENFFQGFNNEGDAEINIVADWPDDIAYFSKAILTGPGKMIDIPGFKAEVVRIDAYPSKIDNLVQHNAYCDAVALHHAVFVDGIAAHLVHQDQLKNGVTDVEFKEVPPAVQATTAGDAPLSQHQASGIDILRQGLTQVKPEDEAFDDEA